MENPTSLDQQGLSNILSGSGGSLIPESLVTTLTVGFIVINLLGVLFVVAYLAVAVRNWKVQSAILHMQKDLADIKTALKSDSSPEPAAPQTPPQPGDSNKMIATEPNDSPTA